MRFCRAARSLASAGLLAALLAAPRPLGAQPAAPAAPKTAAPKPSAAADSAKGAAGSAAPKGAGGAKGDKGAEKSPAKGAEKAPEKTADKGAEKDKAADKSPGVDKAPEKSADKAPEKSADKASPAHDKPSEASKTAAEKTAAEKTAAEKTAAEKSAAEKTAAEKSAASKPSKKAEKPAAKPSAKQKKAEKPGKRPQPRKAGSEAGEPDEAARRVIAGSTGTQGTRTESPELRAMQELDLALFPSHAPNAGAPWEADGSVLLGGDLTQKKGQRPRVLTSGVPPQGLDAEAPAPLPARDLSWLRRLTMPDIPVRWDERVIRYLEYYRDNPRGRSMVANWVKRSGRYGAFIRRVLRENGMPEDIMWLALVESGFDPTIYSPVGAAGLWQFMPHGARVYGLTVDRWIDERLDPERSTLAAARYLADLHKRFGGWELAFAAYNMGYGGLLASIRKYNTNDFWELSRLEAGMPLETALYVPKIVAMAIVARNKEVFGVANVELDPAVSFDKVTVGSGIALRTVAAAAGAGVDELRALNPQLLAGRTPPGSPELRPAGAEAKWVLRVPPGSAAVAAKGIPKLLEGEARLERYLVRWGESLDAIATFRGTTRGTLQSLNDLRPGEVIRPGTVIFVPAASGVGAAAAANLIAQSPAARPVVVTPAQSFVYPNRRRVFYRVIAGDTLRDLGAVLGVTADEMSRWNMLDPGASLHEGMTLQAYIPKAHNLARAFVLDEKDARVIAVGSPEFFDHFEGLKGRRRVEVAAREGDTFQGIAKRYGLTMGMLERINHRSRSTKLLPGDRLVVYVPNAPAPAGAPAPQPNDRNDVKPSEKPETAVASADTAGDDAPEVKRAVLRMTPDEAEGDGDEGSGEGAAKAPPEGDGEGAGSKESGSPGRAKATLSSARP